MRTWDMACRSVAMPGSVVHGLGPGASLLSASHAAGQQMSRTKARESFVWGGVRRELQVAKVELISAGIDEAPGVYKDNHKVMAQQRDLVVPIARLNPRLVKMTPRG